MRPSGMSLRMILATGLAIQSNKTAMKGASAVPSA